MAVIKYFGAIADQTKLQEESITLADLTLSELIENLELKYNLGALSYSIAVNQKIVKDMNTHRLEGNDVVALLPPFAGG